MTDLQMVDWLKASMKIALCEKLQAEDFLTPQDLLHHAQRVELDNAVLDARKRQLSAFPNTSSSHSNILKNYQPNYYKRHSTSYPPPLMSISYSASSYNNAPTPSSLFFPYPSSRQNHPCMNTNSPISSPRPIICCSCGKPGRISLYCRSRPKD